MIKSHLLVNCTFICALFLAFSLHLISILLGNGRGARKCGLMLDALLAKLKLLNRMVVYNSNCFLLLDPYFTTMILSKFLHLGSITCVT